MKKNYEKPAIISYDLVDIVGVKSTAAFARGFKSAITRRGNARQLKYKAINKNDYLLDA